MKQIESALFCLALAGSVLADTLIWNGTDGAPWDSSTSNWLDANNTASVWSNGAAAVFASGATVPLAEDVAASSLTFLAGDTTLTNHTLTLLPPALFSVARCGDNATLASSLAGTDGLTVSNSSTLFTGFLTKNNQVLFLNASLTDVVSLTGKMADKKVYIPTGPVAATAYFLANDGTNLTAQFQIFESHYTKCVKIQLSQSGNDIIGKALYARAYDDIDVSHLGIDFDSTDAKIADEPLATAFTEQGYGVMALGLTGSASSGQVTIRNGAAISGPVTLKSGTLALAGEGALGSNLVFSSAITNNGLLLFNDAAGQTLSGKISGSGSLCVKGNRTLSSYTTNSAWLGTSDAVAFSKMQLSRVKEINGSMGGTWIINPLPCTPFYYSNDGMAATVQIQMVDTNHSDIYTKCVKVALRQFGAYVLARAVYARYVSGTHLGTDFDTLDAEGVGKIATSADKNGYGIYNLTALLQDAASVVLSGTNTFSGGVTVSGGTLSALTVSSIPSSGTILVGNGGELILAAPLDLPALDNSVGGDNPILVRGGGILTVDSYFATGSNNKRLLSLDAGSLFFSSKTYKTGWGVNIADNYVNNLSLANGSHVRGFMPSIGCVAQSLVNVTGSSPSFIESGLLLVNSGIITLNVADVTADKAVDLFIPGRLFDYVGSSGSPIYKTGAGTMSLSANNNNFSGKLKICAGAVSLAASGALPAAAPIELAGGSLEAGSCTNSAGALTISANSTLDIGTGALSFTNSSASAWASDAKLTITGTLGKKSLRFGTDATGLTGPQVQAMRYNGCSVMLMGEGYLIPAPKGTVIKLM